MDCDETWTTEAYGRSHEGRVGVLLADGTVPEPVCFYGISVSGSTVPIFSRLLSRRWTEWSPRRPSSGTRRLRARGGGRTSEAFAPSSLPSPSHKKTCCSIFNGITQRHRSRNLSRNRNP
ncbi:hypothetical protein SUDANB120_06195 (plasmid) [Streptomyces sp. enrichment culture]